MITDGIAAPGCRRTVLGLHVGDAAQGKRDFPSGIRFGQALRLRRGELQRGGVAFGQLLAVLGFDELADGEHAHVVKERLRVDLIARSAARGAGVNDVDAVVGQDQPADAGLLLDARGDRAHARRQDRGQDAAFAGDDHLQRRERLARQQRHARHQLSFRLAQFLEDVGVSISLNVGGVHRVLRPFDPGDAFRTYGLTEPDVRPCDQDLGGVGGDFFPDDLGGVPDQAHHAEERAEPAHASNRHTKQLCSFHRSTALVCGKSNRPASPARLCSTIVNG